MKRKNIQITATARCEHILKFLWLWKVATTATISKKFYANSTIEACYRRLKRLEQGRFIQSLPSKNGKGFVWSLDKSGFAYLKDEMPPETENGYLSEHLGHDLLVLAVQLGDWIFHLPKGWHLFTEQQMRRYPKESYPQWVSKSKIHRPDGYWYFNDGSSSRLLALEVELSQKKLTEYETTGRFYSLDAKADRVIWITGPLVNPDSIHSTVLKAIGSKSSSHSFITLKDFLANHWQSKVCVGKDVGASLYNILVQSPSNASPAPDRIHFFDTRKYPVNSVTKDKLENHRFFHVTGAFSL